MANVEPLKNKDGEITSYRIRVYKGRDLNGKKLKPYEMTWKIPPKATEKQIEKKLNEVVVLFENECKEGTVISNKKQTFREYAEYVMKLKKKEKKKHRTLKRYGELLERINPAIGHIKMCELNPQILNKFYEQLAQNGMNLKTGGYLSDKTILEHHRVISTIYEKYKKENNLPYNIAENATPPVYKKKEANFLEIETIETIRKYLRNEPLKWQVALELLIFTGGRRGEIAGLKINKINISECTVDISEALLYASDIGVYTDDTKTESSDRLLSIPESIMILVEMLIKELKEKPQLLGDKWTDSGYLLTQENGKPMHPDSITDYCKKFRKKYNEVIKKENPNLTKEELEKILIPNMNPHAFRHSHASILIFNGTDLESLRKRLGHASSVVTQTVYSHLLKNADKKTCDTFASNFIKKEESHQKVTKSIKKGS